MIKICDYGCGNPANFYMKTVKKWCCSKSTNHCPSVVSRIRNSHTKSKREKPELCDYGCGQEAKYKFGRDKWCCSKSVNSCSEMKKKNSLGNTGKIFSEETKDKMRKKLYTTEIKIKMSNGQKRSRSDPESYWNSESYNIVKENLRTRMLNGQAIMMNSFPRLNIDETKKKIRKIKEERGLWLPKEMHSSLEIYTNNVLYYTNISMRKKYTKLELKKRGNMKDDFHLDHNFSITSGFKLGILPCIIGSKTNIRLINTLYNRKKLNKCDITIEELFKLYSEEK